jgi:hypothetical protein
MEAALDEERISVLALLEGAGNKDGSRGQRGSASSTGSSGGPGRSTSPFQTPRSPVRSMLDIAEEPAPRNASIAATNGGITNARSPVRSMLDVGPPPPIRSMLDIGPVPKTTHSAQTSPTEANHKHRNSLNATVHPRSMSDVTSRPVDFGPRAAAQRGPKGDPSGYQFSGYLPSNPGGPVVPKRNTLAGVKPKAMSEAVRGGDLSGLNPLDRGRHRSIAGTGIGAGSARKSMSPSNRQELRSNSPHSNLLKPSGTTSSSKFTLDDGTQIDMNSAFRRLSDANLALAGGSLAALTEKGQRRRTDSGGGAIAENARLVKDYSYGEDEGAVESSDDDHYHSTDDEHHRGRKQSWRGEAQGDSPEQQTLGMGRAKGPRPTLSLMAAAEEERECG